MSASAVASCADVLAVSSVAAVAAAATAKKFMSQHGK